MKVVHAGFDGLEVAFQGALSNAALDALQVAKEAAQAGFGEVLADVGKVQMHVAETGARGGYAYRTDTGPEGETWFFKRGSNPTDWNIRVSVKSLTLAMLGLEGVKARLYEVLDGLGATVVGESIGRIDFAVDFLAPDFELDPGRFVQHWRCKQAEHSEGADVMREEDAFAVQYSSRRVTSVTVGSMPNRQVIVYDKRAEVIAKRKEHWWKIWGLDKADKRNRVWRVEVRAGKRHLKERWNLSTWEDIDAAIGDVLTAALDAVRYVGEGQTDSNVTRQRLDAIWEIAREQVAEMLAEHHNGVLPCDFKAGRRDQFKRTYEAMFAGMAASYAVVRGLDAFDGEEVAAEIAASLVAYVRDNLDHHVRKVDKARRRLHFTCDFEREMNERAGRSGEAGNDGAGGAYPDEAHGDRCGAFGAHGYLA